MYTAQGIICSSGPDEKSGWYFLRCDPELSKYVSWFWAKGGNIPWTLSKNGVHVTFIAGEKDHRVVRPEETLNLLGEVVNFSYDWPVYTNGRAFWFNVQSKRLNEIRQMLNLPIREGFHVTLGNYKNIQRST